MPAQVKQAIFQPISPDLDIKRLVEASPNFKYATRVPLESIEGQKVEDFEKLVLFHVIIGGKPLVIEGFQKKLPSHLFGPSWLDLNVGREFTKARDLLKKDNIEISMGHYLKNMAKLTNQYDRSTYKDPKRQRLYLKDIDCPEAWAKFLEGLLPPSLFYLNETTGDIGGPASTIDEIGGPQQDHTASRGVAPAGDLMSSLAPEQRAENMMCYIGHEGTYTPAHREMCGTIGHNIMVEASGNGKDPWGNQEREGSSLWFMTESGDRHIMSEYWLSILGHDIEVESHFAQINAWVNAPFTTYVVEQRPGDFILIPPLAPHQVWNRGTRTMKAAWNRTTTETLDLALTEALPRARMVCRDEQYKNKSIVFFTLLKYSKLLEKFEDTVRNAWDDATRTMLLQNRKVRQLKKDFWRLFNMFKSIILSEMFVPEGSKRDVEFIPYDSNITCGYCRSNIFNRFLTCPTCIEEGEDGDKDTYDVCMECYVMGRSCGCVSNLKWVEQIRWKDLVQKYEEWRRVVIGIQGGVNAQSPLPLDDERKQTGRKTLAQICQDQMKVRPWCDITKPLAEQTDPLPDEQEDEEDMDAEEDGRKRVKRRKSKKTAQWLRNNSVCHICKERHPDWKMAHCECGLSYCYGVLYRAFDQMPREVLERPGWKCPRCCKDCSCGACRKLDGIVPYEPKGTLMGYDTRKVADPRSVEVLVDYGRSNLYWLNKDPGGSEGRPYDNARLRRRKEEALRAKAKEDALDEWYVDDDDAMNDVHVHSGATNLMPIDPALEQSYGTFGGAYHDRSPNAANGVSQSAPKKSKRGANAVNPHDSSVSQVSQTQLVAPVPSMLPNASEHHYFNHAAHSFDGGSSPLQEEARLAAALTEHMNGLPSADHSSQNSRSLEASPRTKRQNGVLSGNPEDARPIARVASSEEDDAAQGETNGANARNETDPHFSLVQSDAPAQSATGRSKRKPHPESEHSRKRKRSSQKGPGRRGKHTRFDHELSSGRGEEERDDDDQDLDEEQLPTPRKRKESAYLQRRTEHENEEYPDELPKARRQRRTSSKPRATDEVVDVDDNYEPIASANDTRDEVQTNRSAKLQAMRFSEGQISDLDESESEKDMQPPPKAVATPKSVRKSILSRPDLKGRKVKIVSAKNSNKKQQDAHPSPAQEESSRKVADLQAQAQQALKQSASLHDEDEDEEGLF